MHRPRTVPRLTGVAGRDLIGHRIAPAPTVAREQYLDAFDRELAKPTDERSDRMNECLDRVMVEVLGLAQPSNPSIVPVRRRVSDRVLRGLPVAPLEVRRG